MNVTVKALRTVHKGKAAEDAFAEIARIGGFGEVTKDHTGGLDTGYEGGLDLTGVLDEANKDVPEENKKRIRQLIKGIDVPKAETAPSELPSPAAEIDAKAEKKK